MEDEEQLMRQAKHPDPRVRVRAVESLLKICEGGQALSLTNYRTITEV